MSNTKRISVNERSQAELRHMMETAAAASVATAAAAAAAAGGSNALGSNNIATLIDGGIRHQGLLKKLVKILKINDLIEEYRKILLNVQSNCSCGRTRPFLEEFAAVEAKYKELIIQSLGQNSGGGVGGASHHHNGASLVGGVEDLCYAILDSDVDDEDQSNDGDSDRPTLAIGSDLNNNKSTGNSTNSNTMVAGNNGKAATSMSVLHNGISMMGDYDEEEDDEEDEDDFEDELDIEEYMALAEVIEKEEARMEKIADDESEFIYVIRYAHTKKVVCYECIVGGSCGFLTRERSRMLLHIAKHFQLPMMIEPPNDGGSIHNNSGSSGFASESMDLSITPVVKAGGDKSAGTSNSKSATTNGKQRAQQQPAKLTEAGSIMKPILTNIVALNNNNAVGSNLINAMHPSVSFVNGNNTTNGGPLMSQFRAMVPIVATGSMGNTIVVPSAASMIVPPLPQQQQQQQQQQMSPSATVPIIKTLRTPLDKPIHCPVESCAFTCDQNYKLRTHNRQVHEKVRPYHCDWPGCFGAYKTRSNLASHRMVHTGEKPFVCNFPSCGAKFARKYDCERHRRIHSEKMYACKWPGCGKKLCDPYNLERHMMVHKGELPYRCPITNCVRGFRELRYLRDHVVNTHKFLPDTAELRLACINTNILENIKQEDGTLLDPEIARLVAPIFNDSEEGEMLAAEFAAASSSVASSVDSLATTSAIKTTTVMSTPLETSVTTTAAAAIAAAAQQQKRKLQQEQKVVKLVSNVTTASASKVSETKPAVASATTTTPTVVMVSPVSTTTTTEAKESSTPSTPQRAKTTTTNAKPENTKKPAEKPLVAAAPAATTSKAAPTTTVTTTTTTTSTTNAAKPSVAKSEPKQPTPVVVPVVSKHNLRSRPTPPTATAAAAAAAAAAGPPNKKVKRK